MCGGFVAVVGAAYLVWIGVLGGERSGFLAYTGRVRNPEYESAIPVILFRLWVYTREVFTADWISWPVFAWFLGMLAFMLLRRRRDSGAGDAGPPARKPGRSRRGKRPARGAADVRMAPSPPDAPLPVLAVAKIVLVGALFVFYSALLSVQPVSVEYVADLRYFVGALPLLLVMKGLFVEWVWSHSRVAGGAALAALLLSSVGAAPFNVKMVFTGERTLGLHLPWFVGEVHRPYRASIRAVSDFLHEHAARDDLVYVASFPYREAMTFAAGDHVRFCCVLDENTPLPRERIETLGPWIRTRGVLPDWIVIFGPLHKAYWEKVRKRYRIVAQLDVHPYPTQRPEINVHAFSPLRKRDGISILRRRTGEQS